jgi:membrane protein implicated in regulation of membrane protease activity
MDSLPTGTTQSWVIVAAVAFSPVIILFLADAIGWLTGCTIAYVLVRRTRSGRKQPSSRLAKVVSSPPG